MRWARGIALERWSGKPSLGGAVYIETYKKAGIESYRHLEGSIPVEWQRQRC